MKIINYGRVIPNFVEPKLGRHGFKYDESLSYPPQGHHFFTRIYWGITQTISICPVEYDVETVEVGRDQNDDTPTEVDRSQLLNRDPGFRLWLSNRYLTAVLRSSRRSVDLIPKKGIVWDPEPPANSEEFVSRLKAGSPFKPGQVLPYWWAFHGDDDLRRVLSDIVQIIVIDGLDWFEHQVVDTKNFHQKLDRRRRQSEKDPQ